MFYSWIHFFITVFEMKYILNKFFSSFFHLFIFCSITFCISNYYLQRKLFISRSACLENFFKILINKDNNFKDFLFLFLPFIFSFYLFTHYHYNSNLKMLNIIMFRLSFLLLMHEDLFMRNGSLKTIF